MVLRPLFRLQGVTDHKGFVHDLGTAEQLHEKVKSSPSWSGSRCLKLQEPSEHQSDYSSLGGLIDGDNTPSKAFHTFNRTDKAGGGG